MSAAEPWLDLAECKGVNPSLFFPDMESKSAAYADVPTARTICESCRVRAQCLWAGIGEKHGVWGGKSELQRRRLRKVPARLFVQLAAERERDAMTEAVAS